MTSTTTTSTETTTSPPPPPPPRPEETPILIIGGGLAGLSTACLLARHNTPSVMLEKHTSSSPHPRAVGFTTRTMEIFAEIGVAGQIPQTPGDFRLRRVQVQSLVGEWGEEIGGGLGRGGGGAGSGETREYSPWTGAAIAQDKLEPILRERARELGCDVRMGHRMVGFEVVGAGADDNGKRVLVKVTDNHGIEYAIQTRYLVAADGHRSSVRHALGISTRGRGHLQTLTSVLFRAPSLDKFLASGFHQFQIRPSSADSAGFTGFLTTYNDSRWVLMWQDEEEQQQRQDSELRDAILQATGIPDLKFEVLATGSWDLQGRIAETFVFPPPRPAEPSASHDGSSGVNDNDPQFFLIGDASHTLPPTRGGYGANTGIGDAHNLAWKLATVVHGTSKPALLRSYDTERRAVAWVRHHQTFAGPDYARCKRGEEDFGEYRDVVAVELGQVYESAVIIGDENGAGESGSTGSSHGTPVTLRPDELKGRPGSRAPHVPLITADGRKTSSLDLFGKGWVLVSSKAEWLNVGREVSEQLNVSLSTVRVPSAEIKEEKMGEFGEMLGIGGEGVSLVRPDGHVVWRGSGWSGRETALRELTGAFRRAACLVS